MKTLPEKVKAVKKVYEQLNKEIAQFQKDSKLYCISGCGECCKKPDIECTPLEFLPLALQLFDEGRAEQVLEELDNKKDSFCYLFNPHITNFGGMCNEYPNRGLICRLFGYAARINKEGRKELVTCKLIKESQNENYLKTVEALKQGQYIPVFSAYYTRLTGIDHTLMEFYPINKAMKKALETVLHYYAYRRRRKPKLQS
jgi:Fe-S-cluster containining protein